MKELVKIDLAGRIVIPKKLRERYGLTTGREVRIIQLPDGITLIPERSKRRMIRRGRITSIDTGTDAASSDVFDVSRVREDHLSTMEQ